MFPLARRLFPLFCLLGMFSFDTGWGNPGDIQPVQNGPLHEAYVTRESGQLVLEAISIQPPQAIDERIPPQDDPQARWIPGYWAWSKAHKSFLWISGVWRRFPPNQKWIPGYWKQFEEGWVWLAGFWSSASESDLTYIREPPPDQIDERVPPPPSTDYFWMAGYWFWDRQKEKYVWHSGRWEFFDPNWCFVPAHYMWREQGYIFVSSYWDWPLTNRGIPYGSVFIEPFARPGIDYEPALIVEPETILEIYYPFWPDYLNLFHTHFHFEPNFWKKTGVVPPWWWWDTWWSFSWHDSWGLWWWWCHPDYPQPFWLDAEHAAEIAPPPRSVLKLMNKIKPPPIITPYGAVGRETLVEAIDKVTGGEEGPILPTDPQEIEDIKGLARPAKVPKKPYLRPSGPSEDHEKEPQKPSFGPENGEFQTPPQLLKPPQKPNLPSSVTRPPPKKPKRPALRRMKPKPQRYPSSHPQRRQQPESKPAPSPQPRSGYTPKPAHPTSPSDRYLTPRYSPSPQTPTPPSKPQTEIPYQGAQPEYQYPQTPLHIEDQGRIQSRPQPQVNPPGPKVHAPQERWGESNPVNP